nr:thioesterase family protein [Arthrospira platensis]
MFFVAYTRTVYFSETDAAGVVYFAQMMSMCHQAYEAALINLGINLKTFVNNPDFAIPIVHASMDYRQPIYCGDRIVINLSPQQLSLHTFQIEYQICLADDPQSLIAQGITKHISINPSTRQRQPLPPPIKQWLNPGQI